MTKSKKSKLEAAALNKRLKQFDSKVINPNGLKKKKASHNTLKNKAKTRNVERRWRGWRESDGESSPVVIYNKNDL